LTVHLVYGDAHAHPDFSNSRADLISKLIQDVKPDVVVNIGDNADMASLSSYDKGLAHFYGRNYRADVDAHLEFESRVWDPVRALKKKLPFRVTLHGNHEDRISRALAKNPELAGALSLKDLELERYYDAIVPYSGHGTPGEIEIDGVSYAHFVVSGISGRALAAQHQGFQLLAKRHRSTTVGHQHVFSYECESTHGGKRVLHGLSIPCMTDYPVSWAGNVVDLWSRGIIIKRNVEEGNYDLEFVSLKRLVQEYG
jgi:hypothetical protein